MMGSRLKKRWHGLHLNCLNYLKSRMSWRKKLGVSWGRLGMKYSLSDISIYVKEKVKVAELDENTYISTENMIPNKGGVSAASSLPMMELTQKYRKGDVLVSNIRPYFRKIWQATNDGGCSNDVLVFRAKEGVSENFLYYVLANNLFFDFSTATSKGTKMPRGDKKVIMEYKVPDYGTERQEKIASVLKCIDDRIVVNKEINDNLFHQAQAIYKAYFVDMIPFGSVMPSNWHLGTVSEIIELHDSKRIPLSSRERAHLAKSYPYYGATSVMDYVDKYLFDGVYLLLGEDGTVVDRKGFPILQYVEGKFWVNNHAHILTGKNGFTVAIIQPYQCAIYCNWCCSTQN